MALVISGSEGIKLSSVQSGVFTYFTAGQPLPSTNIGPIWHDDYAAVMTWKTYGTYTGYVSINIGQIIYVDSSIAPPGWLKCAGQSLGTEYEALIAFRGSNVLMDLRAEFIRGLDDGRGVDAGRSLRSTQNATRVYNGSTDSGGWGGRQIDANIGAGLDYDSIESAALGTTTAASYASSGPAITSPVQSRIRVRPRNIALLACIKY